MARRPAARAQPTHRARGEQVEIRAVARSHHRQRRERAGQPGRYRLTAPRFGRGDPRPPRRQSSQTATSRPLAAGITDPQQASRFSRTAAAPSSNMRLAAIRALEIPRRSRSSALMTAASSTRIPRRRTRSGQRPARRLPPAPAHRPGRSRRLAAIRRGHPPRPSRSCEREGARRPDRRRTPASRSRQRPLRAMVRRHLHRQGNRCEGPCRARASRPGLAIARTVAASGRTPARS